MGLFDSIMDGVNSVVSSVTDGGIGSMAALNPTMILGTAASMGSSLINANAQAKANDRSEANAWEMQRIQHEREDNAVQRRAEDMKKAGINPLMAAGNAANSSSAQLSQITAPQVNGPDILGALTTADALKTSQKNRELTDAQIGKTKAEKQMIQTQTFNEENSIGGALGDFIKGLRNKDNSMPSLNSIRKGIQLNKKRKQSDDDPRLRMP